MNPIEIAIDALIEMLSAAWENTRRGSRRTWSMITRKCWQCGRRKGHKMDCGATR